MRLCLPARQQAFSHCAFDCTPKLRDAGIRSPPRFDQRRKFFLLHSHLQSAHIFQCLDFTAVPKRQLRDFSFFAKLSVDAVFDHRHSKHLGRRSTVDISPGYKSILTPFLTGQPCEDSCLDRGKVGDIEKTSFSGYKCCTDQLRQHAHHG